MTIKTKVDNLARLFDNSAKKLSKANGRFFIVSYRLKCKVCPKNRLSTKVLNFEDLFG
jgi:hypothetical protein